MGQTVSCRVMVFGSSGVGKTSMINMLTGHNYMVRNAARGCTFDTVEVPPVRRAGIQYHFFDTAGLNETDAGTVNSAQAVQKITNLLNKFENGMNLLIYVKRIGSISNAERENYELFCNIITNHRIPVIGVITGCEHEEPMSRWVQDNANIFAQNRMVFNALVATSFQEGGRFETVLRSLRQESATAVWDAIRTHSLVTPVNVVKDAGGIVNLVTLVARWFTAWLLRQRLTPPEETRDY